MEQFSEYEKENLEALSIDGVLRLVKNEMETSLRNQRFLESKIKKLEQLILKLEAPGG